MRARSTVCSAGALERVMLLNPLGIVDVAVAIVVVVVACLGSGRAVGLASLIFSIGAPRAAIASTDVTALVKRRRFIEVVVDATVTVVVFSVACLGHFSRGGAALPTSGNTGLCPASTARPTGLLHGAIFGIARCVIDVAIAVIVFSVTDFLTWDHTSNTSPPFAAGFTRLCPLLTLSHVFSTNLFLTGLALAPRVGFIGQSVAVVVLAIANFLLRSDFSHADSKSGAIRFADLSSPLADPDPFRTADTRVAILFFFRATDDAFPDGL